MDMDMADLTDAAAIQHTLLEDAVALVSAALL